MNSHSKCREESMKVRATTILCVRRAADVALGADGQVTVGSHVMKTDALKLRKLAGNKVLLGFTGSTADAMLITDRFESRLSAGNNNLRKASLELAKEWRSDALLRTLEVTLIAADFASTIVITSSGDVIEPSDGVAAIGSGGVIAASAARALLAHTQMPPKQIALESLKLAAETCIYTNANIRIDTL
jgi:ATP-dependent HslUV protease, peptidase subunit HslV